MSMEMDYIIYGSLKNPLCDSEVFIATAEVQLLRRLILGHGSSLPNLTPSFMSTIITIFQSSQNWPYNNEEH